MSSNPQEQQLPRRSTRIANMGQEQGPRTYREPGAAKRVFKRKSSSAEFPETMGEFSASTPEVKRVEQHHYHYWGDLDLSTKIRSRVRDLSAQALKRPSRMQPNAPSSIKPTHPGASCRDEPKNEVLLLLLLVAGALLVILWQQAPVDARPQYSILQKAIQAYRLLITDLRAQGALLKTTKAKERAQPAVIKDYIRKAAMEADPEDLHAARRQREPELVKWILKGSGCQDAVMKPDFALKSIGGRVIAHSASYESDASSICIYWICWRYSQPADVMLQPDNTPGNCWALRGSRGYAVLKLGHRIRPTSFTVDHISILISQTGDISSAPREIALYGLSDEAAGDGTLLGQFIYDKELDPTQTFILEENYIGIYGYVKVHILSNWGHPDYTCLYRVRVHGEPEPAPTHADPS
ncbi:sperm-associated antigen 4 protein-like [Ambystoma mexicanum]|uniref:sperm-associated antigen 4 protein-like n=1 Tax=Ambystoma mexicanum TaxID=8296 RepID=UPI0037E77639